MPVHGFPCALETTLNALVGENRLSSWKIMGGETFCTVTLRFQVSSMAEQGITQPQSYRSKPPSAMKRDSKRKAKWSAKKQNAASQTCEGPISQDNIISLDVEYNSEPGIAMSQVGESRPGIEFVCNSGQGSLPLQPANTSQIMTQNHNINKHQLFSVMTRTSSWH